LTHVSYVIACTRLYPEDTLVIFVLIWLDPPWKYIANADFRQLEKEVVGEVFLCSG
jgi:hypothetical protein